MTAILRLDRPIAAAPGDRFVLRRSCGSVLGARVLDADPPRGISRRRATLPRIAALAATAAGTRAWTAARLDLHGIALDPPTLASDVAGAVDDAMLSALREARGERRRTEVLRAGAATLRRHVGRIGDAAVGGRADLATALVAARLDALIAGGHIEADADRVRLAGVAKAGPSAELVASMDRLVDRLAVIAPPPLLDAARELGCPPEGIRELERTNRIVRLDQDLAWAFETYRELVGRALAMAADQPLTPAAYRDATGTSRKYVMAILEDLDRRGLLRRTPNGHVPGPRAPRRPDDAEPNGQSSAVTPIGNPSHP